MTILLIFLFAVPDPTTRPPADGSIRLATFNIWELSRQKANETGPATQAGTNEQLKNAAAIIQTVRPDILLINEIDAGEETARAFLKNYLDVSQFGRKPIDYPHVFTAPVNTGHPSALDLNNNGDTTDPEDAWGFGEYPGQYGMAMFSRFPIDREQVRTFQIFRWADMPDHNIPDGRDGRPAWYSNEVAAQLRLSSKSHWDIPIMIGSKAIHILASHPTPPVFDGTDDRNGRRNHDEIRLWADYLTGGTAAEYLVDDEGHRGGLAPDEPFVIMGDLNSDPVRGEKFQGTSAIEQLLNHPRLQDPQPLRPGDSDSEDRDKTAHFGQLDYVLPDKNLKVTASGIFWPAGDEPLADVVADREKSSDHCLVWADVLVITK